MPLENGENGIVWRDTTPEDIKAFEASLSGLQEVGMSEELEARLNAALAQRQGGPSLAVLVEGNRRLYPQLERVLAKGMGRVDIVVPVFNAWHITRRCLQAVLERTGWPYKLITVDDASDAYTERALGDFMALGRDVSPGQCPTYGVYPIRNEKNRGFAATVNRGIRAGSGEYVCLLNSDVIVTPGWLMKMVLALESDPRNAIVCPATNNTAVVDVPMSPGASYLHMNQALEGFAQRRYPEIMPTGFCFMFRRSLLDEIGYFDEAYSFAGEETDFWWRCIKAGYRAVMADDTYVYHQRAVSSSALGHEKDHSLRKAASARFNQLHPEWVEWRESHDVKRALGPLREPIPPTLLRAPTDRYRVCWLVHDARACGAMRFIADIANELCERGVNAKVAVLKREGTPEEWLGELRSAPVYFDTQEQLLEEFAHRVFPEGLVIAGTVELAPTVQALVEASSGTLRGCLHAQSFDPALAKAPEDIAHLQALYKLLPDVITGSQWVADEIAALGVTPFAVVHPGVDRTLFYPRDRSLGDERPTVMIPMNPSVWWRGWDRGLELIAELDKQATERGVDLRILVYGVDELPIKSRAICLGVVSQARLATVLGTEADVLVDPSYVHSYGMPVLEAMASNVLDRSWNNRGVDEVGGDVAYDSPAEMATWGLDFLSRHIASDRQRFNTTEIQRGVEENHDREKGIDAWIAAVEAHFKLLRKHRRICMVVPHLRKWGGPTTMLFIAHELAKRGHQVQIVSVYEDIHPGIAALAEVPISKGPELPEADLYITNSDNPWVERVANGPKPAIMLKLSHNPRFKAEEERGLNQGWDAVVCSTEWLAEACHTPTPGWNYPVRSAEVIGWWHYEHARFRCPPSERAYGDGTAERPFVIGTLVHSHPSKGTKDALAAIQEALGMLSGLCVRVIGIGEVPERAFPVIHWQTQCVASWEYRRDMSRDQLAATLKGCDFWVGASKTEGLGRMALEAMSAGVAIVALDTGGEHLQEATTALLLGPDSKPDAIGARIRQIMGQPELAMRLREKAFETAERAADPEPCIQALEEVIANVCA